jgi:alpha-L-fucosidase
MNLYARLLLASLGISLVLPGRSATPATTPSVARGATVENAQPGRTVQDETPAQRDARMQWWREARFGMFVHWGLYSGLAGTWDGKPVATKGGMEWIQQRVKADTGTYAQRAIPLFKPTPGFAREWARLAKEAGCRYIVFTTKHHDGFALHDSKVSDYDAGSVLHRDLVKEIVDATRAEGLRVGFYHSVIDWHHDQYAYAKSKQLPHPLKGQPYPNGERDHAKYLDYLHAEVAELMSNYGKVDVLWWDYSAQDFQGDEAWRAFDLMKAVRAKQPKIMMNNRLFRIKEAGWSGMGTASTAPQLDPKYGDFITPEQHIPATGMPGVDWETCMTLNTTWGFSEHDHAWKSDETLVRNLIDIASKGGNYLLNIGPKGDGSVPAESIKSMRAIGAWMKTNGTAIYGTTASPFAKLDWGRCTRKGQTLFLHVFEWPADGTLLVPLLNKVARATLLTQPGQAITTKASPEGLRLQLPTHAPDGIATVISLSIEGEPRVVATAAGASAVK